MTGKQTTFGFARNLGEKIAPKKVLLFGDVLFLLDPKKYYLDCENPDEQPINGIFCTFCFVGELQLNRIIYLLRGEEHFGNGYEYGCNNCAALFYGAIKFSGKPFTFEELNFLIQQEK